MVAIAFVGVIYTILVLLIITLTASCEEVVGHLVS
jgi:hypothetical protein